MIYVIEEVVAASEIITELSCPHCQANGEIEISITRTKATVGFVPMFAWGKRGEAMCHNCGLPVSLKEAGEPFKRAYLTLKAKTRTPIYLWSGMIVCFLVLLGIFAQMVFQDHSNPWSQKIEQTMLTAPKIGDLYEVSINQTIEASTGTTGYTLARVEKIDGDLVTLRYRKNSIKRQSPPMFKELADNPGDFYDKTIAVQKSRLANKDLFQPNSGWIGQIYAAKRP